jgi:predicted SAM-dependent methyltransferase
MRPQIEIDLLEALSNGKPVVIEQGCGPNKQTGCIGIDLVDLPGVDIVPNIEDGLGFLPDASVDKVVSRSFCERVGNLEQLVEETVRVLKPEGVNSLFVPHFSNPFYSSESI